MKKLLKQILVFALLICNLFVCTLPVSAGKAEIKRNIAIVFDNSGTMYYKGEKAWKKFKNRFGDEFTEELKRFSSYDDKGRCVDED